MVYGQWTYSNLSVPTDYMGATVLGSKAYFAGGEDCVNLKSKVEIYDTKSGQWNTSYNLSVARELPFAVTCGSKVIFAGGVDFYISGGVFSTVDIYDTIDQTWSVEQLSVPRLQAAVVSHGSKVLFAGGANLQQGEVYDVVDIYDVETGVWTTASLSEPRVVWWAKVGDLAIFAGGYDLLNSSKRVDIYNFTTNTWSIDSLSVPRAFVGMTNIGNKVLIAGGMTMGNVASNIVDIYDASTGNWSTANLSQARAFCDNQNAVTASGKAYFVGGGKINLNGAYWTTAYNTIDIYDEADNSWSVDYMPLTPRIHHAVVATDNKIIIAGGYIMTPPFGCDSTLAIYTCPSSSCLPEGITFTTQEQIDNFQINNPGCTEIEGEVTIEGWNITNLNGLNLLTSIGGYLKVRYNSSLTSLTGLDNLTSIGGGLQIGDYDYGNPALTSLSGLDNLISIGGNMFIGYNPELTDLTGLESVTSLQGDLTITGNNSLTNCAIQNNCNYLNAPNGVVEIYNNGSGCNSQSEVVNACGGSAPCLPYGNYYLLSQADVDNFQINFPACNDLAGNLTITGNSIVNLTGLNQVYSIGGSVSINYCDNLENLNGLENLYTIGGSFSLHDNHRIKDFSGLENLDSIGALVIGWTDDGGSGGPIPGGNDSLVSLSSLSNLTYVRGIEIGQNPSLISLAGLDSINANTLVYVAIGLNSSLSTCEVQSICAYLAAPNAYIIISDNAPGCNSPEEVEAACAVVGLEEVDIETGIRIFPNPARDMITVSLPLPIGIAQLTLFNITGKKLMEKQITQSETRVDISKLPKGMYFLRLQYENAVKVAKIIKD